MMRPQGQHWGFASPTPLRLELPQAVMTQFVGSSAQAHSTLLCAWVPGSIPVKASISTSGSATGLLDASFSQP